MNYNKSNTPIRKSSDQKAYEDNWDRIFNKKHDWRIMAYNPWYITMHCMITGELKHERYR